MSFYGQIMYFDIDMDIMDIDMDNMDMDMDVYVVAVVGCIVWGLCVASCPRVFRLARHAPGAHNTASPGKSMLFHRSMLYYTTTLTCMMRVRYYVVMRVT